MTIILLDFSVLTFNRFLMHDPRVYKNPMDFNPERFMGPNPEMDPKNACFGFGRRYVSLSGVSGSPNTIHHALLSKRICPGELSDPLVRSIVTSGHALTVWV